MGAVVRPALYVPSPPVEVPWVGTPIGTSRVLLAALVGTATFFGAPGQSLQKMWRADIAQDHFWQWTPPNRSVLPLGTGLPIASVVIPEVPEEQPGWIGRPKPAPLVLTLQTAAPLPFSNPRRFDVQPEPGWTGASSPVPQAVLSLTPALPPFTAKPTRQFNIAEETPWTGRSTSVIGLLSLQSVSPFGASRWNFNVAEETPWLTTSRASLPQFIPQSLPPFVAARWGFNLPDDAASVLKSGTSSAPYLPQLTTAPFPAARWSFNVGEDASWTIKSSSYQFMPQPAGSSAPFVGSRWVFAVGDDVPWTTIGVSAFQLLPHPAPAARHETAVLMC